MYTIVVVIHVLTAIFLILLVLLQTGKAGGLGGIFGGGGADQLFSTPSGSQFLRKTTIITIAVFFFTSITLTFISYRRGITTVTSRIPQQAPSSAPPP
ncbi:MAG: preprotein translocase subunit SecG [Elusimicrobiota bacterium]|nr:preprotein translocase subunit SecG [Elusimicrobiota bacterium]